ncbi:hypothetical protein LTR62_002281 [Meristemomyces frigidus]|uniref:Oxysterol-binding protein n=1 Tax=Meristemomyces frigidus TaxID=1508187 RepID=A0AAN7TRP9_9PEZI|nr:hypothetical protein LTR62_002281 [Meristemomyces frigidus]
MGIGSKKNSANTSPDLKGQTQDAVIPSTPTSTSTSRTASPMPNEKLPDGKTPDDSSKLRTFLSILKRFIGVTDIAAVRFSLPAQLLEPIPNLEYWHYLDRPETFVAIGDSEDALGRMLGCLRFWFTKDLKYVHGKPCKPYNSTLGEFFRCQWQVEDTAPSLVGQADKSIAQQPVGGQAGVKVNFLTEQTSHHPPVSAYYVDCPEKGVSARGYDQLSAKFTGTSIKVTPGEYNQGIYINIERRGEEYKLTHPAAFLGGFIRGNLSVTVADTCFVSCPQTGIKVILHYLEEGYFGKTQNKVEGIIYRCADVTTDRVTRLKDVPDKDILGRIDGMWTDKVYFSPGSTDFKKTSEKDRILLVDVNLLRPVPKFCPPLTEQLPNESRLYWNEVTESINAKQFTLATNKKTEIEERQRERAAIRSKEGREWKPRFFTKSTEPSGRPELTEDGKRAVLGMREGMWRLEPPPEYGAM